MEAALEEYSYCKNVMKKHFNKNLVVSVEYKKGFQSTHKCWVCNKVFVAENIKVRDHDHMKGKCKVLLIEVVILFLNWLEKFL